jgi:hypothetical protein
MTDDFVTDGILPDDPIGDEDFDPNEFESDDILDDVDDSIADLPPDLAEEIGVIEEDDDDDGFPDE